MKDTLVQVLPIILTAIVAALGRKISQWIARSTYTVDVAAVRTRASAVAADVQRTVDSAKAAGSFNATLATSIRADAIARVKRLEPLAVKSILTALGGDEMALDDLIGGHVEEAVRSMRGAAPAKTVVAFGGTTITSDANAAASLASATNASVTPTSPPPDAR